MSDVTDLYFYLIAEFKARTITGGAYDHADVVFTSNKCRISSLKIPDGWRVILYSEPGYTGSVKVLDGNDTQQNVGTFTSTDSLIMEPSCVILYADADYGGTRQILRGPGRYIQSTLSTIGNDNVGSLRVPPGWKVTLHQFDDFSGMKVTYTADTNNVGWFNDRTSSITVEMDRAVIYQYENFLGNSQVLDVGQYPLSDIKLGNDAVSSLRVPPGWKVTLYRNAAFAGDALTYTQDTATLGTFNNCATSIKVERITAPWQPTPGQNYTLTAIDNGLVADVFTALLPSGYQLSQLVQLPKHGGTTQQFRFEPAPDGFYYLRSQQTGQLVSVFNATTSGGTIIALMRDTQGKHQQWYIEPVGTGYTLTARHSRLTMTGGTQDTTFTQRTKGRPYQILQFAPIEVPLPAGKSGVPAPAPTVGGTPTTSSLGTRGGTTTTTRTTPAAVSNLGTLTIPILFYEFSFPLSFTGDITVDPYSMATTYSGAANLPAPFNVSVNPLAVSISAADGLDWMLKFGLPQSTTISSIVQNNILGLLPSATATTLSKLVMPYLSLYNNSVIILAKSDGDDADYGNYLGGFNVYTRLKAAQIPPFDALQRSFPSLGLDSKDIVLGVGASGEGNFFVNGQLVLDVPLVSSQPNLARLKTIGLNVTKDSAELSVGAQLAFTVTVGGDVLSLDGGLTVAAGESTNVTLWGALEAADGAWKNPFGLKGVTINSLGVELGVAPQFPWVVMGLRGEVHIGNSLLGGSVAMLFDASDIAKCILSIYSEEGLNLPKIISALTDGKVDGGKLLNISLTNFQLYIAPSGGTIAGKSYDPGYAVGGNLDLWGYKAALEGHLDPSSGGSLKGTMAPVRLTANGTNFLDITATNGTSGAAIQIDASTTSIGGFVDCQLAILGTLKAGVKLALSPTGFSAKLGAASFGLYSGASLTMEKGLFKLAYAATISVKPPFPDGTSVPISVACTVNVEVSGSTFSQSIAFSFSAMGKRWFAGPYIVSVPFGKLGDLVTAFRDNVRDLLVGSICDTLAEGTAAAFNWVKSNVTQDLQALTDFFKGTSIDTVTLAKGLVNNCGTTAENACALMQLGASETASILHDAFGESYARIGDYLVDVRGFSESTAKSALQTAGAKADQIADWAEDTFNPSNW